MDTNGMDFSIGLEMSLELLERYRQNGTLHAEVHHVPGVRGYCHGSIQLIEGKVVSCSVETKDGRRQQVDVQVLTRLDATRGPFAWMLLPSFPMPQPPSPPVPPHLYSQPPPPLPQRPFFPPPQEFSPRVLQFRQVAPFNPLQFSTWSARDKMILRSVFLLVDGRRNAEEIKSMLAISPEVVDEALQVLQSMKVIVFQ